MEGGQRESESVEGKDRDVADGRERSLLFLGDGIEPQGLT
jgi:hypothetical protein